jgi:hypothetical protein
MVRFSLTSAIVDGFRLNVIGVELGQMIVYGMRPDPDSIAMFVLCEFSTVDTVLMLPVIRWSLGGGGGSCCWAMAALARTICKKNKLPIGPQSQLDERIFCLIVLSIHPQSGVGKRVPRST